jgi:hypothetical protein
MSIDSRKQLEATRQKLAWLEREYASAKLQPTANAQVHELTLRSLKRMINQMKEEITRFESTVGSAAKDS